MRPRIIVERRKDWGRSANQERVRLKRPFEILRSVPTTQPYSNLQPCHAFMRSEVKDIRYDRTTQNTHNDKDRHTHPIYEDRHYTNTYPPYWNICPILPFMIGQILINSQSLEDVQAEWEASSGQKSLVPINPRDQIGAFRDRNCEICQKR